METKNQEQGSVHGDDGTVHEPKSWYTRLPVKLLHNKNITDGAVRLYAHMLWRYGRDKKNYEGRESMSEFFDVSEATITNRIAELASDDWVIAIPRGEIGKGRKTNFYHIFLKQVDCRKYRQEYGLPEPAKLGERKTRKGVGGKPAHKAKDDATKTNSSSLMGDTNHVSTGSEPKVNSSSLMHGNSSFFMHGNSSSHKLYVESDLHVEDEQDVSLQHVATAPTASRTFGSARGIIEEPDADNAVTEMFSDYLEAKAGHAEQTALPLDDASEETPPSVAAVPPSLETPREIEAIGRYLRELNLITISKLGMLTELYALKRMLPLRTEMFGMPQTEAPLINAIRLMNINDMGPAEAEDKLRQLREMAFAGTVGTVPQSVAPAPSSPARQDGLPEVPSGLHAVYEHDWSGPYRRHYGAKPGELRTLCGKSSKKYLDLSMGMKVGMSSARMATEADFHQCLDCARIASERAAKPAKARKPSAYSDKRLFDALAALYGALDEADKRALNGRIAKTRKALVEWALAKLGKADLDEDEITRFVKRIEGFKAWYARACERCSIPRDADKFMSWWVQYTAAVPIHGTNGDGKRYLTLPDGRKFEIDDHGFADIELRPGRGKRVRENYFQEFLDSDWQQYLAEVARGWK